jgi:hypothetical protein
MNYETPPASSLFSSENFEDGFIASIPIRYGVNIREWHSGKGNPPRNNVYGAGAITLGTQQGVPINFFAFEWANPRLGKSVQEVRLHGSSGFQNTRGNAIPENALILPALSAVKKRSFPSPLNARQILQPHKEVGPLLTNFRRHTLYHCNRQGINPTYFPTRPFGGQVNS